MSAGHVTDAELTAYLDGEADGRRTAEIAAAVEEDGALAARLAALALDREGLVAAFRPLLAEAPALPAEIRALAAPPMSGGGRVGWRRLALAAGALLGGPERETWQDQVASYHELYVAETLSVLRPDPDRLAAVLAGVGDLTPLRAQILGFGDATLVQIAFLGAGEVPIALCILRDGAAEPRPIEIAERRGKASATWSEAGYAFLLVGGQDAALIAAAARRFSRHV